MLPQKVIISQQRRVYNLLCSPNPEGYTRMQISRCLGIERATICRRVAELRDLGILKVVRKGICPITHERAEFLTCNPDVAAKAQAEFARKADKELTGKLF